MAGGEFGSMLKVFATASAAMAYVRLAAASLRPGLLRLVAFAPVLAVFTLLPFAFSSAAMRGNSAFFLVWLGCSKLLLLAVGCGPLDPSLPLLPFVFTGILPVRLRSPSPNADDSSSPQPGPAKFLLVSATKASIVISVIKLYRFKNQMNRYLLLSLYCIHIYVFLDLLLGVLAFVGRALGMELEPQFDKPYLASSLRDFWGRRWNLMVSAILRPTVYKPVRRRLGAAPGILATFLFSGLMHEVMFYYLTLRFPDGVVTAFFIVHGACTLGEWWWTRSERRWRPPRAVGTPLVLGFVMVTSFWLFFPPLVGGGMDEKLLKEWTAALSMYDGRS